MSDLLITPRIEKKTARIEGTVCAGEKVAVRIAGAAGLQSDTIRFRVNFMGRLLALFPAGEGERMTVEGDDLTFTLNLCTEQMQRIFRRIPELELAFILDDPAEETRRLYFAGYHTVFSWSGVPGADSPADLSGYSNRIQRIADSVSELRGDMDAGFDEVDAGLAGKVDKVAGKSLSTCDLTYGILGSLATKTELSAHAGDSDAHLQAGERVLWNSKMDAADLDSKQDALVRDGYLYVPDNTEGHWRRVQSKRDPEVGVVLTLSDHLYVRGIDGTFTSTEVPAEE